MYSPSSWQKAPTQRIQKSTALPWGEKRAFEIPDMSELRQKSRKSLALTFLASLSLVLVTTFLQPTLPFDIANAGQVYGRALWLRISSNVPLKRPIQETSYIAPLVQFRTNDVRFDNYSLILKGQRIFLHSGEFHTFRLPVPSLWIDILEKVKAAGMNAISVYTHMGLINPSPGVVDFDGFRALQPLYDAAKETGVWIVLRPGPYINAETTAGGISHWATSEIAGSLRTNSTDWKAAWQAYVKGIIKVTAPYQINKGGPVIAIQIDNEFTQSPLTHAEYFEDLKDVYHASDIVVPLTYNDPGPGRNFVNGTGAVDLYGLDAYPQGFDCSHPTTWRPVVTNYHEYHSEINPSQPWYIPEFQGGSFDPWGPTAPGYSPCRTLTGSDFQSVFNLNLWASNAKLINYYMLYGGTSWGGIPYPGVYTSYDYGAAITESRELTTKFDELKRQAMFIRSSPDFYKTEWIADTNSGLQVSTNNAAFITLLKNRDTGATFYVARQSNSTSTAVTDFKLNVTSSDLGARQIPIVASFITLGGRQSKIVVTDYSFGSTSRLSYSTAQIFFAGAIDGRDVLFLHGDPSQEHEVTLNLTGKPNKLHPNSSPGVRFTPLASNLGKSLTTVNFLAGITQLVTVWDSDTLLVLYGDSDTAATFWSPTISGKANDPLKNFWSVGTNESLLVGGPYLVREATIQGSKLSLRGDLQTDVQLSIIAPKNIKSITWNGQSITGDAALSSSLTSLGGFVGSLGPRTSLDSVQIPKLKGWKYKDSLPEIQKSFDDRSWVVANHTSTNIPIKPSYGDGKILYGCDYGFCENTVLWRGHFKSTGLEKSVNLSINGGTAFAASVWINDVFLGTSFGNSTNNHNNIGETDNHFVFPEASVVSGRDNVITVLQDNMGLEESAGTNTDSSKSPRGIRGFAIDGNNFTEWKVQGKIGGYRNYPDKTRGVLNEGGLFAERKGWHLPRFSTAGWDSRELSLGLPQNLAGVGFFVTTFKLDIPRGLDVMVSFTFEEPLGQPYRAFLFVNGWMMGKRVGNLGPQAKFPVHQGILNYQGENTVAVALWSMTPNVTVTPNLQLTLDGVYDGGVEGIKTDNSPWSATGRT